MDNPRLDDIMSEYRAIRRLDKDKFTILAEKDNNFFVIKKIGKNAVPICNKLKKQNHPHIVNIIEVFENDEDAIVIEEYIDGKTIGKSLEEDGLFDEEEVQVYALQLCDALDFLHKLNIVHRDITAANVIISCDGELKVIDFGISRTEKKAAHSDTVLLGTNGYAAPEQYGFMQSDKRTDIYSFGVLINLMLTGKFPSEKLCGGYFKSIVVKCINFLPERRYDNIMQINNDILVKGKTKKYIAALPGFRRGRLINKIIAVCVYIFFLLTILSIFFISVEYRNAENGSEIVSYCVISFVFAYLLPFFALTDFLYYTDKIYFVKDHKTLKIIFRVLVALFCLFLGAFLAEFI